MTMTRANSGEYFTVSGVKKLEEGYEITYKKGGKDEKITLTKEQIIHEYLFLKRVTNGEGDHSFQRIPDIIQEMDTSSAGIGGTADSTFSGDHIAPNDSRNIFGGSKNFPMTRRNKITDTLNKTKKKNKKNKKKSGKKSKK